MDWQKYEYLYDHPVEVAIGFDVDDRFHFSVTQNDPTTVNIPKEFADGIAGGTLTHNHPSGTSISVGDIEFAIRYSVSTMIVVGTYQGKRYRYTITLSDELLAYYQSDLTRLWTDTGFAKYEIERTIPEIAKRKAALYDGGINDPELNFIYFNALWAEFVRQLWEDGIDGFDYSVEVV